MKTQHHYVCPRCDHLLVPVHSIENARRRVIALTCPEPYCDHVQHAPQGVVPDSQSQEDLQRTA
jgi:hypothetical protein